MTHAYHLEFYFDIHEKCLLAFLRHRFEHVSL